ncbi:alpha/beta hydrolase [Nonomuraea sp. NN258]|uniref:alpha/beta fold hydrolase n=1 Tax=Nonomuraea antri TaxID=2730852 RepID=UPI001569F8A6|nr:alpha/beta hydrolase [Nonomuraea antri]NRQ38988.1 alpha/beta hydrolase [Nonomuraea antri]
MRDAQVLPDGSRIRWAEVAGREPVRVYVHGLGASAAPYFLEAASRPELAGHRSLFVDLLGFGTSDRPTGFGYSMEEHADALATALRAAGVRAAQVVAHSMGGTIAVHLAERHPELVAELVLVDANLDPIEPAPRPTIATYTEDEFVRHGWDETLARVGPHWAATMRLAGREALHRSGVHLTRADVRERLRRLPIPRAYLYPAADGELTGAAELVASGVRLIAVPDTGHNIMIDNVEAFAREVSGLLTRS